MFRRFPRTPSGNFVVTLQGDRIIHLIEFTGEAHAHPFENPVTLPLVLKPGRQQYRVRVEVLA